jgi:hypothetical protein
MILGSKLRIHMGCGEPLQSRSWLRHSLQTRASAGNDVKSRGAPARQSAPTQGVKCKS